MDQDLKVRENRARRAAERRGWKLEKSRARDPHAIGFGTYRLIDAEGGEVLGNASIDEIEARLSA